MTLALAPAIIGEGTRRAVVCHDGVQRNTIRAAMELAEVRVEADAELSRQAFGLIDDLAPDVVVLDLTVAGSSALGMVPTIRLAAPEAVVVAVAPPWMIDSVKRAARAAAVELVSDGDVVGLRAAMTGTCA